MKRGFVFLSACMLALATAAGCGDSDAKSLAPTASGSTLGTSKPLTENAKKFKIDGGASKVSFLMEAPIEKIRGRIEGTIEGELFIDATKLSKTSGNIVVDLDSLVIFQKKKADKDGDYGAETKSEKQNEHAREWLEIDPKVADPARTKNRRIEFKIKSVENVSQDDISKANGEVKVTLKATGDFLLHGRQSVKTADLEATLTVEGGQIKHVAVKTKSPFAVGLEEHDVRPRDAAGKGLAALSDKVAKEAMVDFDLQLKPDGSQMSPMPSAPPSAEPPHNPADSVAPSASAPAASAAASATPN